jgi:hypothetical protein
MRKQPPDPLLLSSSWRAIQAYWNALGLPCGRCGLAINYQAPGTSPFGLHVGHIIGRDQARLMGWSDDMINALANTRPEHARCSEQAGARYGNRKRGQRRRTVRTARVIQPANLEPLRTSRVW